METNRLPITWVFLYECTPEQQKYLRPWLQANGPQVMLPISRCYIGSHRGMIFQVNGQLDPVISKGLITYTKFVELTESPLTPGTIVEVRQHLNADWLVREYASTNPPRKSGAIYKTSDGHSWMYLRRVDVFEANRYKAEKLKADLKKAAEKTELYNLNTWAFGVRPSIVDGMIDGQYVHYTFQPGQIGPDISKGWAVVAEGNNEIAKWLWERSNSFKYATPMTFIGINSKGEPCGWNHLEFITEGSHMPGAVKPFSIVKAILPLISREHWKKLVADKELQPQSFKQMASQLAQLDDILKACQSAYNKRKSVYPLVDMYEIQRYLDQYVNQHRQAANKVAQAEYDWLTNIEPMQKRLEELMTKIRAV